MQLSKLNWKQAEAELQKDPVIIVPVGSVEQHGPIGPLGTDSMIADDLAGRLADMTDTLVLPTVWYGSCPQHMSFPGTINIGADGLYLVLKGITTSLIRHGARRFIFVNGHGGNIPTIDRTMFEIFDLGCISASMEWWIIASNMKPEWKTGHGDCQEVSMAMAVDESSVNFDYLVPNEINHFSDAIRTVHINVVNYKGHNIKAFRDARAAHSTGGYGGFPSDKATRKQGVEMREAVLEWMAGFVEEFKTVDLAKSRAFFT